jgi:hypothetical protein
MQLSALLYACGAAALFVRMRSFAPLLESEAGLTAPTPG